MIGPVVSQATVAVQRIRPEGWSYIFRDDFLDG